MKTQSKTEIRNNTAKATKLLRGIDNEATAISKAQVALNKRVASVQKTAAQVTSLLTGISTTALAASTPAPAAKPAKAKPAKPAAKAKPVKAAKPAKKVAKPATKAKPAAKAKPATAKKAEAKRAKPAKVEKVAKPATAPKPAAAKKAEAKPAAAKAGERPPLVQLINNVLDKTPGVTAAEIYKQVVASAGYFSRQSVYVHLKKTDLYTKTGDGAAATFKRAAGAPEKAEKGTSDEEADAFVEKAGSNPVTAAVS